MTEPHPTTLASAAPSRNELSDTRRKILDAAERLFAERGVDGVSVRAILKEAGVNVALAHYHFGSREGLIAELMKSRVGPLIDEQLRSLDAVEARGQEASLEDVLRAYCAPAARLIIERPRLGRLFAQLDLSPNPDLRALGRDMARDVLRRFGDAVVKRLPLHAEPRRLFLRFQIALGAPFHLLAHWDEFVQSTRKRFEPYHGRLDVKTLTEELVAFTAAGLRAGCKSKGGRQ